MKKFKFLLIFILFTNLLFGQNPHFYDSLIYRSTYNEIQYGKNISHQSEVTFRFEKDLMITTMKDQMSRFRTYGITQKGEDKDHIWETHQCLDNSGTKLYISLAYEKPSHTKIIIINYNDAIFWFEVEGREIPQKAFDVMENLENLGHFNDGNFGTNYTDEEVNKFLNQFGDSNLILHFMLKDLFFNEDFSIKKHHNHKKQ